MNVPVATLDVIGIDRERGRFGIQVVIGTPYLSDLEPVSLDPLHPQLPDIAGENAFQSLCLASRLVVELLHSFVEKGGRLTYDGENEVPLDAYIRLPSKR
jgi:hypothetical protein